MLSPTILFVSLRMKLGNAPCSLKNSIDLVVAVNPDFDTGDQLVRSPQTMWPLKR